MANDYIQAQRLGYRVPRSILLPPYLMMNPYFVEFMDAVDEVFETQVDAKIDIITNIRNMWTTDPVVEQTIADLDIIPFDQWPQPERSILVKQSNALGMNFQNAGVLSNDAYQQITRHVGQYWYEKGTQAFIEFINYCLGSTLTVVNLWTTDYVTFVPFSASGTPIWEGGPWYPTTHVQIEAADGLGNLDLNTLISFFYEIANYNLVLYSVDSVYDMYLVDRFEPNHITADIVAIGLYGINEVVMSNQFRYGAAPPPMQSIDPSLPTLYQQMGGVPVNFSTAFLLADPSAWFVDSAGRKFPVYSTVDQTITEVGAIPTQLMGYTTMANTFPVMYGPISWIGIPGSSRATARLPAYGSGTSAIVSSTGMSTRMVGRTRNNILTNPLGFVQITPGNYVPYW